MTKAELVDAIAKNTTLTKTQAREAVEAFVGAVTTTLKKGGEVRLVGFGSFVPVSRKAGVARNPRTGASVRKPASKTCRFKVGETLKSALN
jgi:DNA-binding protein HU-beta